MSTQEAINLLKEESKHLFVFPKEEQTIEPEKATDIAKAISIAIDALNKITPKAAIEDENDLSFPSCPTCGYSYWYRRKGIKYCPECGQAIYFGEEKNRND